MWNLAEGSKIALQHAAPADIERGAVEGAAKCGIVQELAGNRLESPFLHRTHCCRMMRIDDDALPVHCQQVHVETFPPVRAHVFRFAPELGHCSLHSACLKSAISGSSTHCLPRRAL